MEFIHLQSLKVNGQTMYRAELLLPINSPIKEAITLKRPVEDKKLAQMAVALEVGEFICL